jgi:DNA-binding MarR family transcriptional regulator
MDERLYYLLTRAQRRLTDRAQAGLADLGVTPTQAGALFVIHPVQGATIGGLAQALDLAQSAASGLAQRLERLGLVQRSVDLPDARKSLLNLTPQGHAIRARAVQRTQAFNSALARDLDPADLAIILSWLNYLAYDFEEGQFHDRTRHRAPN